MSSVLAVVLVDDDSDRVVLGRSLLSRSTSALRSAGASVLVTQFGELAQRCLGALDAEDPDVVLLHEASRAFTPVPLIEAVVARVRAGADAVVPVLPMADTVKRIGPAGLVEGTEERSTLRTRQTPLGLRPSALRTRLAATDALAELSVGATMIDGDPAALRVRTSFDAAVPAAFTTGAEHAGR